jgi:hypothetical protein
MIWEEVMQHVAACREMPHAEAIAYLFIVGELYKDVTTIGMPYKRCIDFTLGKHLVRVWIGQDDSHEVIAFQGG